MTRTQTKLTPEITHCLQCALDEDIGTGDATSESIIPPEARLQAQIVAKQDGVVAGLDIAGEVLNRRWARDSALSAVIYWRLSLAQPAAC